jgi:hypothetical protein
VTEARWVKARVVIVVLEVARMMTRKIRVGKKKKKQRDQMLLAHCHW